MSTDDDASSSAQQAPSVLLVDGSSYLYRAYHAMPDLRADPADPASQPTGAIRGMVNMLTALRKDYPQAPYMACVFDAAGPTFRNALYAQYKANRSPMPDDLRRQIEPIHTVARLLGWLALAVPGVEADDVIGTLARAAQAQGLRVLISSGDKDMAQLVTPQISIFDTLSGKRRDEAGVLAEFGVRAAQMIDYQTLMGDAVDNVPGVTKVGPKTAAKWLAEYGTLDNLLANAAQIKGAAGENLRNAVAWLPMGKKLLTIRTDCDLSEHVAEFPALHALAARPADADALAAFYQQYGFKALARATAGAKTARTAASSEAAATTTDAASGPATNAPGPDLFAAQEAEEAALAAARARPEVRTTTVLDWATLDVWLDKIGQAELTALDTETTSLDAMQARLVGLSLSTAPGEAAYIPLAHSGADAPAQLPLEALLQRLKPWLQNPERPKLGQHFKYDRHVFANHGIDVQGYVHDTLLQSYVLEVHRPHGLQSLAERHLGRSGISYEDLCGKKGVGQIGFAQVPVDKAAEYACEDAEQTLAVHHTLWPRLQSDPQLRDIYQLEIATSEALWRIERHGVLIDTAALAAQSRALGQRIAELEQKAHTLAGQPFNLGSPKQIGEIFFEKLGLPVLKKTATGKPSTDEEVLEKLAADYPLPACILEHRGLSKLKGTYTDKLPQMVNPHTGRVHTHYAQAVAVTGRLSSNDPNLQNIPVRTPEGRRIREAFIAPAEHVIVSCDYSQIELRIMAHLSGDAALLAAFAQGRDIHRATAAEVFGLAPDQVSAEQRRYAKVINFGLIYGMSSFGLARNLGIDNTAAQNYIDRYFDRYPGVRRYMHDTVAFAHAHGYVQTAFGRRLYLPDINGGNGMRRKAAERQAINAPMQGTAADLIKKAMLAVQSALGAEQRKSAMVMQVHDELVLEVPEAELDWIKTEIPRLMAGVARLKVPLLAETGVGKNWDEAH
ncbi:MAG: DNA polymerase I [Burkholderiaceae bacterium]|nr:DNA polymerase I [Burkholderiaceae bacterium]